MENDTENRHVARLRNRGRSLGPGASDGDTAGMSGKFYDSDANNNNNNGNNNNNNNNSNNTNSLYENAATVANNDRHVLTNAVLHHNNLHSQRMPFTNTVHNHGIHNQLNTSIATTSAANNINHPNITSNATTINSSASTNHSQPKNSQNNNNNSAIHSNNNNNNNGAAINKNNHFSENTTLISPFFINTVNYESTSLQGTKPIQICKDIDVDTSKGFSKGKRIEGEDGQNGNGDEEEGKQNNLSSDSNENDENIPPYTGPVEGEISMAERTEEQILDENRRMSFKKRQAEDDIDISNASNENESNIDENDKTQEFKKLRIKDDLTWDDLDSGDSDDPLMVSEYVEEIFNYLHDLEINNLPDPNYLQLQRNLRPKMRSILVDWMVEVHLKFKLLPETLYLSINIMDRFLSKELVQVDRLQLLATGSLFIAAKYEEVYSPSIKNYAYVTDGAFSEDEILGAEKFILEILNFNMSYPNPMNFLRRISKADDYDVNTRTIGKYLLEITIIDHKFIGYLPSLCAASAMFISRKMVGKNIWNNNLIHYSGGYKSYDLRQCCLMIMDYLVSPIIHEEFFKKYASRKFMKVSMLARQWAKRITRDGKDIIDDDF